MLFRVSGSDVYLAGTIHLLPEGSQIPSPMLSAIAAADDCVFESDLDHSGEPSFACYPDGDSIDRYISPDLFSATSELCHRLDIPGVLPDRKLWWVALVIGVHLMLRVGNLPQFGADRQLWEATKRAGKRPFVLESPDVLRAFDSAPTTEQVARLNFVVSDPQRAASHFDRLHAAWRACDTAALTRELEFHLHLSPITFRALVDDRNRQWLPQILGAIEHRRSAVFAVGALHLAGDCSLQRLLSEHGHTVVPT